MEPLSKAKQKWIRSLQLKKNRDEGDIFVVEGEKMVLEGLTCFAEELVALVVAQQETTIVPNAFVSRCNSISEKEFAHLSSLKTPNKLLAVFRRKTPKIAPDQRGLVLDGIQDPGNMGTILRLADWFGISQIICSEDTVDVYNPKVIQASMGAIFRIQVSYTSLDDFLRGTQQPTFGAMLQGIDYRQTDYPSNALLIMGNEGKGVRPSVAEQIQYAVTIPRIGAAESLNVASATGILLAQMVL